jgi:site-specific DNA recombinase
MKQGSKTGIIYVRVSSAEQVEGTSLETQERICRAFAEKEKVEVLEVFIEKGESAKTANRTEFNKAIVFCSKKKPLVDYFIVYKLDRFARNQDDHAIVRANLKRFKTELRSATEPINESPVGRLMEAVISGVAEFDNSIRAERSKNGMRERFRQGVWCWVAPVGYTRATKGGNLIIEEKTAPYIRLLFEEYSKGTYSYLSLSNYLEKRGFRTRTGKKPCMQWVQKTLCNPLYCGLIRAFGEEYEGKFEPIVSKELFWQCQPGMRKSRFRSGRRSAINPNYPLRKLVICEACQSPITGSASTGRKGVKYPYYHHHKKTCPVAKAIPKKTFEQQFIEYLETLSPKKEYERLFKAIVVDVWKSNYKKLDEEHKGIEREIEVLKSERQKVFDLYQAGRYTDEEFSEQKIRVNNKITQKELLREEKRVEEFDMDEALEYCFRFVRDTAKTWVGLEENPVFRTRFQNQIFPEKVEFDGEKFGTTNLSLIYKLNQPDSAETSHLVTPEGIEPSF